MAHSESRFQATESLRLLGQAYFGAFIGVLIALAIARSLFPPGAPAQIIPEGLLPWNLHNVWFKPREKAFYLLSLVAGGLCGYLATYRILVGRSVTACLWLLVALSVPIGNEIVSVTLPAITNRAPEIAALVGAGFFLALMLTSSEPTTATAWSTKTRTDERKRWPFVLLLLLLTLVLIPSSFQAIAAKIGVNFHPVSFLFGPALYSLGNGLLPGIDYYSQYSLGIPWLFHFIMGTSPGRAVLTYTVLVILATWLFYAHLISLLQWLYRSWTAAAVVAFIPLILVFVFPDAHQAFFFAPSNTILRYPLLTVCAVLTGAWADSPTRPKSVLFIAAASAASLFLELETGIIMMVSAALTMALVYPWRVSIVLPVSAFIALTLILFLLVLLIAFGPGVMQAEFFRQLFEGVIFYGRSGFGAAPGIWTLGEWNWLYHLVAPGVSLATLAVVARACGRAGVDRRRAAILGFLATSGLLLLVKYSNQSLAGVWQMSAIGPFSVLGWWAVALLRRIDAATPEQQGTKPASGGLDMVWLGADMRRKFKTAAAVALIALAFAFLYSPGESRNPAHYGLNAWLRYPSLLMRPFSNVGLEGCVRMDCVPNLPAQSDVDLITSRTQPGEQVAIVVDIYDWTYLLAAHRPPLMFFLPSAVIFGTRHYEESLQRLKNQDYLFVPNGPSGEPYVIGHDDFNRAVGPLLGTVFQQDGVGDRLSAWKRVVP